MERLGNEKLDRIDLLESNRRRKGVEYGVLKSRLHKTCHANPLFFLSERPADSVSKIFRLVISLPYSVFGFNEWLGVVGYDSPKHHLDQP
jgi:hypothetical protein